MKKTILMLALLAAAAGAAVLIPRLGEKKSPVGDEPVQQWKADARPDQSQPASGPAGAPASAAGTEAPAPEPPPMEVRFETPTPPKLNERAAVTLSVVKGPGWPVQAEKAGEIELLLRLPVGVKLASEEGWTPSQDLPVEKEDVTGPWSVFERKFPVAPEADGALPDQLAEVEVPLVVVEEGINWIISTRARLSQGQQAWQTFGVLFATVQGEQAEFHATPKTPSDTQSAKAD